MPFGTQYIPSLVAATGFTTSEILKFLSENYKNQLENEKDFQKMQLSATQGLASSEFTTINKQADSEESMAKATLMQGYVGLSAPIASTLFQGARRFSFAPTGLNSELRGINEGEENLAAWGKTLETGRAPFHSADEENGVEMDVFKGHTANEVPDEELDALRRKDYTKTNPKNDPDAELVATLKSLRGGSNEENDPDIIKRKKLYSDVQSKREDQEKSLQSRRQRYENNTDQIDRKLESTFQGLSSLLSGMKQKDAADSRREQAEAQETQEYAKYLSDSLPQNIQVASKVADDINQAELSAAQVYYSDFGRANQPV